MLLLKRELRAPFAPSEADISIASPARAVRLGGRELTFDIIGALSGLEALESDWNDLFNRAGKPSQVFQTHGFVSLFAKTYGIGAASKAKDCACAMAVVTARRAGRLVLVWPLLLRRECGLKILSWLGEPIAQYGDVVLDAAERLDTLQAAWAHAQRELKPDVVRLRRVRADASIAPLLASLEIAASEVVEAPCITLAAGGSSFEERQSGKAKKNRRRLLRRLEEQGQAVFDELGSGAEAGAAIKAGLADKRDWLAKRGLLSPAMSDSRFDAFMLAAATSERASTGGTAFSLSLDGRPVALALGFRAQGRLMLHLITYAADVEKCGAGVLNLEAILRAAEAEGLVAVDLLPPKADYKLDWADTCVEVGDHCWGVTVRGKAWRALYDGFVRPHGKRALTKLPLRLRQRFSPKSAHSQTGDACPPLTVEA